MSELREMRAPAKKAKQVAVNVSVLQSRHGACCRQQEKESKRDKERVRERIYRIEKRLSLCGMTTHMPAASDASMIASTLACAALTVLASPSTSIRTIDRPNVGEARLLSTNDSARYP